MIIQFFQQLPAAWIVPGPLCPNVLLEEPLDGWREVDQFFLIALKGGVQDHKVNDLAHALLHGIWFQDHLRFPDFAATLSKLVGWEGPIGFCPTHAAYPGVSRRANIFNLA